LTSPTKVIPHITASAHKSMPVHCFCNKCHGTLVHSQTKFNHERVALKNRTVSQQNIRHPNFAYTDTIQGESYTMASLPPRNTPGPHNFITDCPSTSNAHMNLDDGALSRIDLADVTLHAIDNICLAFELEQPQFN
jgi:hypothetical protein